MGYSPESPREMSSDASSPYPDRPIRPLPKKPLRERLSPDVAQSIRYPPARITAPLFNQRQNPRDEKANNLTEPPHPSERERADEIERNYISRRNGDDMDSDDDRIYSRPSADSPARSYHRYVTKHAPVPVPVSAQVVAPAPASTTSSADEYDRFENTNNKKKRKIPTGVGADSSLNGVMANMEISGPEDYAQEYISGHGISGPGRGRYGRRRSGGRSPLRTLDASSNWSNSGSMRTQKQRQTHWQPAHESTGIISASIATAAERYPITPSGGQENVSILQQASQNPSSSLSTAFKFEFGSNVPPSSEGPPRFGERGGPHSVNMDQSPAAKMNMATQTTGGPGVPAVVAKAKQSFAASQESPTQEGRRRVSKQARQRNFNRELSEAAQHRKMEQQKENSKNSSQATFSCKDCASFICPFCEYEQIFGEPPWALIRSYEIKDRKKRKIEAERQRLLAKAKTPKNRKGKKSSKAAPPPPAHNHAPAGYHSQSQSQGTQSEENYGDEDDYGDDYPQGAPPSAQTAPRGQAAAPALPSHPKPPVRGGPEDYPLIPKS